jgi:hypothetical protein
MAATTFPVEIPSTTFIWKEDPSAGSIPAYVYYSRSAKEQGVHPIGRYIIPNFTFH